MMFPFWHMYDAFSLPTRFCSGNDIVVDWLQSLHMKTNHCSIYILPFANYRGYSVLYLILIICLFVQENAS